MKQLHFFLFLITLLLGNACTDAKLKIGLPRGPGSQAISFGANTYGTTVQVLPSGYNVSFALSSNAVNQGTASGYRFTGKVNVR